MKGKVLTVHPQEDFTGKVVIVTGAGSGIGRAAAHAFARAGAQVLGVGRRTDALEETAVGHSGVIEAATGRWGRLDVLVNNAGTTKVMPPARPRRPAPPAPSQGLDRQRLQHLRPPATARRRPLRRVQSCSGTAHPQLGAGTRPRRHPRQRPGPGPTESQALAAAGLPEAVIEEIKRDEAARIPLGRRGEPEEVASWILRLADPATTWLTGQILTIDGGLDLT
jgi:NAD(P)-dependent dehydrogenase (short-subunit alcohol dehydrogenase family)